MILMCMCCLFDMYNSYICSRCRICDHIKFMRSLLKADAKIDLAGIDGGNALLYATYEVIVK